MQNRLTVMPKLAWAAISRVCRDLPRELSQASDQKVCDAMTGRNAHGTRLCCFERDRAARAGIAGVGRWVEVVAVARRRSRVLLLNFFSSSEVFPFVFYTC
jgi:hypothetical protein